MKVKLTLFIILTSFSLFGQNDSIRNQVNARKIVDCDVVSLNAVDLTCNYLQNKKLDSIDIVTKEWINMCGLSECTQRIIILKAIMEGKNSNKAIKVYFENGFHTFFMNRIFDSKKVNYGYLYSKSKPYYGYVPLRHPVDSAVAEISTAMLQKTTLTTDERLICILFSGDIERFESERKKSEGSFIHDFFNTNRRDYKNSIIGLTLCFGIHSPIGKEKIFGTNPYIGIMISTPLQYKFLVDLGFTIRINNNDEPFKYVAFGDTNTVNSDKSSFIGGFVGYKIFENKHLTLFPKLGIGCENTYPSFSKKNEQTQEVESEVMSAIHLSLAMNALIPLARKEHLGVGISYHFCPYNLNKKLLTKFDQHAVSFDVSFRF